MLQAHAMVLRRLDILSVLGFRKPLRVVPLLELNGAHVQDAITQKQDQSLHLGIQWEAGRQNSPQPALSLEVNGAPVQEGAVTRKHNQSRHLGIITCGL
jgi:hypothetical protein